MKKVQWIRFLLLFSPLFLAAGCGSGGDGGGGLVLTGTGTGSFSLNAAKTELTYDITVTGLSGGVTAAHFHNAQAGVDGPVIRTITSDFSNTASGVWKNTDGEPLTPFLVAELEAGRIYVNVHTALNQGGEIRSQLTPLSAGSEGFIARLEGSEEVPPVSTAGTGTGMFSLNAAGTELTFDITVAELSGPITSAHFHNAQDGINGSAVRTITTSFRNNTASGVWKNTDGEPLTPFLVAELEAGRIYVNVHTSTYLNGEIRGQLLVNSGTSFAAKLTTGAEGGGGGGGGNGY